MARNGINDAERRGVAFLRRAWERGEFTIAALALIALLTSCNRPPAAVNPANVNASAAAMGLLAAHDADSSGTISVTEAQSCPGVQKTFAKYDADGDGQLTSAEISDRFASWSADGVGVMKVGCLVTLGGTRLEGATVTFQPEPFFDGALPPAVGLTGPQGQCNVTVDPSDLPASLSRVRGVQPGLYRVIIAHPDIPASEPGKSKLGQEVAGDTIGPEGIHFELGSP